MEQWNTSSPRALAYVDTMLVLVVYKEIELHQFAIPWLHAGCVVAIRLYVPINGGSVKSTAHEVGLMGRGTMMFQTQTPVYT